MIRQLIVAGSLALAQLAGQSTPPTLSPVFGGANAVNGRGGAGSAPLEIYDLSYPTRTKIGVAAAVDRDGSFAAAVKPSLIVGHRIVVVDRNGNTSQPVVVQEAPPSAAEP